ncbi:MAG TPA: hypothetical protein VN132_16345, partial [Bdellovibrio sp.]|nr:hypothetical protein [Bdellovibrio sp.]
NSYYGNKYVTPTLADLQGQLNRCSPALYADSTPDGGQNDVVQRLLNGDSALRNKMFTGLYYHPPYTDYFETYFGLEVQEAIDIFCNKNSYNVSGTLIPSMTMSNPYGPIYQAGDPLPSMYVKANNYRSGLSACLPLSRNQPWQPPAPATPKSCDFETVSGDAGEDVNSQVSSWLTQGYTVGADLKNTNQCVSVTSLQDLAGYQGSLTVGAYRCQ